jgi:hypothetical protein
MEPSMNASALHDAGLAAELFDTDVRLLELARVADELARAHERGDEKTSKDADIL